MKDLDIQLPIFKDNLNITKINNKVGKVDN